LSKEVEEVRGKGVVGKAESPIPPARTIRRLVLLLLLLLLLLEVFFPPMLRALARGGGGESLAAFTGELRVRVNWRGEGHEEMEEEEE
jgi:hypothetical protein